MSTLSKPRRPPTGSTYIVRSGPREPPGERPETCAQTIRTEAVRLKSPESLVPLPLIARSRVDGWTALWAGWACTAAGAAGATGAARTNIALTHPLIGPLPVAPLLVVIGSHPCPSATTA